MAIRVSEGKQIFSVDTCGMSYVFALDVTGLLRHLYWGKKLNNPEEFIIHPVPEISSNDLPVDQTWEEYTPWGGLRFKESSLKATFSDGVRDVVLKYDGYSVEGDHLVIRMKDACYPLKVDLHYRAWPESDLIERWVVLTNTGTDPILLENVQSGEFNLPGTGYHLTNVSGHWGVEQQTFREPMLPGKKILESRRGTTGHNHSPYFVMDKSADDDQGEVWFGVLAYSGNFRITVEATPYHTTRIQAGINNFDFSWKLKGGETFQTPSVFAGYTTGGFGEMSRTLHRFARTNILPAGFRDKIRPVLYNSWEATAFDIDCESQMKLAEMAAEMGVEQFVIDDGWFGARNTDKAGLGDWFINKQKFPDGLTPLINKVKSLGMEFGIWIEPEMVNPDSDLYRNHPDWCFHFPTRERTPSRKQLVLNMTRPEVQEYLFSVLNDLLSQNDIDFVKWDMNRPISEPGADNLDSDDRKSVWHRYSLAVMNLCDRLRQQHPAVSIEACASGGGRVDWGSLSHFDQVWTSDNTEAPDRILIQEGFSLIYPAKAMRAWVTDSPYYVSKKVIPLEFRIHVPMSGSLGIGGNLPHWTPEMRALAKEQVTLYKSIRHIIQEGDLYRLNSLRKGDGFQALQYVKDQKESVVFFYLLGNSLLKTVFHLNLKGLHPEKRYKLTVDGNELVKSGDYLMYVGFDLKVQGDYQSRVIHLSVVD